MKTSKIPIPTIILFLTAAMLISESLQLKANHAALDLPEGRYFMKVGSLYLAVNNPIKDWDYQKAQFADRDYIEDDTSRYSKEVWLKKVADGGSGYYIFSKFGDVYSYLHVNGLVQSNDYQRAYFASGNYLIGKTNYQHTYWFQNLNGKYRIHVGQGTRDSTLASPGNSGDYEWARFCSSDYRSTKYDILQLIKLEDNHVDYCQASDQLAGNAASFYMTSDPQFRYGQYNNGGRTDGEKNSADTYNFLKTQVQSASCPQSFIVIAGDLNHEKTDWQDNFFNKFEPSGKGKIVADILENHDLKQVSASSMVEKPVSQITSDLFFWNKAVKVRYL